MGKFVWFVLGLILGAAATLVLVTMVGRDGRPSREPADSSVVVAEPAAAPEPAPSVAPPKPRPRAAEAAPRVRDTAADDAQMADDAAATGMTSRARPRPAESDAPADTAADPGPG